MTTDRLTRTVREQIALGRLLPLGDPDDAAWITEKAAVGVLRRTCAALPGIRLGAVEITLTEGEPPAVPEAAPVGALPHLPVRVGAGFDAAMDQPLPVTADRLRETLWVAARDALGLRLAAVDLRVIGLLDGEEPGAGDGGETAEPGAGAQARAEPGLKTETETGAGTGTAATATGDREAVVEAAALAVPGVLRLTRRLAGLGHGVRVRDIPAEEGGPGRRVRLQLAVAPDRVPLDVARAVLTAVSAAARPGAPGPVTAAVVVTDVG